jgi:hypothetical protein
VSLLKFLLFSVYPRQINALPQNHAMQIFYLYSIAFFALRNSPAAIFRLISENMPVPAAFPGSSQYFRRAAAVHHPHSELTVMYLLPIPHCTALPCPASPKTSLRT